MLGVSIVLVGVATLSASQVASLHATLHCSQAARLPCTPGSVTALVQMESSLLLGVSIALVGVATLSASKVAPPIGRIEGYLEKGIRTPLAQKPVY